MTQTKRTRKPGVEAGPATHGQGLFATRRFRAGQVIGRLTGTIIDDPDYGSDYCIDLEDSYSLEPDAPWRFVNHSCEPNAKLILDFEGSPPPEKRAVVLEALRSIRAGEEITIDYEWPADSAIPCGCGSEQCRGWIVDPAEQHLLKRRRRPR